MKASTMNNTPNTTPVMHSFKALWQWLMAKPGQPAPASGRITHTSRQAVAADPTGNFAQPGQPSLSAPASQSMQKQPSRPLRVLQVMDAGLSPAQSGRLRISGRMADVCAELDRLAAREALQH